MGTQSINEQLKLVREGDCDALSQIVLQHIRFPIPFSMFRSVLIPFVHSLKNIQPASKRIRIVNLVIQQIWPWIDYRVRWTNVSWTQKQWQTMFTLWNNMYHPVLDSALAAQDIDALLSLTNAMGMWFRLPQEDEISDRSGPLCLLENLEKILSGLIKPINRMRSNSWRAQAVEGLSLVIEAIYTSKEPVEAVPNLDKTLQEFAGIIGEKEQTKWLFDMSSHIKAVSEGREKPVIMAALHSRPQKKTVQPSRYVNFNFMHLPDRKTLPLNEGFISGKLYLLEVSIGVSPDSRFGAKGEQPEIRRPESEEETVDVHVALFEQGSNLSIVDKRLDIIKWPAKGSSNANAQFKLQAKETTEERSSILEFYFYHKTNFLYKARFTITIQPHDYIWKEDERPIAWVYREDEEKFPCELYQNFADLKELSERALNLVIQAADGKNEFILTALVRAQAAYPARITMEQKELLASLIGMREQMDNWRKESLYLDGGYDRDHNYVGDYTGNKEGGFNKEGQQNKADAKTLFEKCMNNMARLGSSFCDKLFCTEDGMMLRKIIDDNLHEGDIIQIWIDRNATDFVFPWAWIYGETVDCGDRYKYRSDLFWGYKYVIEQRPLFGETVGKILPFKMEADHLDIKVGIYRFDPTTKIQEQFFSNLSKKSAGQIQYEVWDNDKKWEAFLQVCSSDILYFFSHGHTAKPETTEGQQYYDMAKYCIDWLKHSLAGQSKEVIRHRNNAEVDLNELAEKKTLDVTYIRLYDGYLQWGELNKLARLEKSAPLVFLNMCESAQVFPSMDKGLVDTFLKKGARGVIGTEIPMIDSFADLFSREFFDKFFYEQDEAKNPVSVGKILFDLRRKFLGMGNPLGFTYTFYGDAMTRLRRSLSQGNNS